MEKKTIVGLVLAVLVGVAVFVNSGDLSTAIKVATDKEAAVTACTQIIKDAEAEKAATPAPATE